MLLTRRAAAPAGASLSLVLEAPIWVFNHSMLPLCYAASTPRFGSRSRFGGGERGSVSRAKSALSRRGQRVDGADGATLVGGGEGTKSTAAAKAKGAALSLRSKASAFAQQAKAKAAAIKAEAKAKSQVCNQLCACDHQGKHRILTA